MALGIVAVLVGLLGGAMVAAAYVRLARRVEALGGSEPTTLPVPPASPGYLAPVSRPLDWPEWRIGTVIAEPSDEPRALVSVARPERPARTCIVLLEVQEPPAGLDLLNQWRDADVVVSPARLGGQSLELRPRQSSERLQVLVISDSIAEPTPSA